jgi:hypothetical protein
VLWHRNRNKTNYFDCMFLKNFFISRISPLYAIFHCLIHAPLLFFSLLVHLKHFSFSLLHFSLCVCLSRDLVLSLLLKNVSRLSEGFFLLFFLIFSFYLLAPSHNFIRRRPYFSLLSSFCSPVIFIFLSFYLFNLFTCCYYFFI